MIKWIKEFWSFMSGIDVDGYGKEKYKYRTQFNNIRTTPINNK